MTRHLALAMGITVVAVTAAMLAVPYRRGALVGALTSSTTALASLLLMQRSPRAPKPLQAALVVMVLVFLLRIVLVGLGVAWVVRAGGNVFAFVVAFFVPYFTFAAVEGHYLHTLSRSTRSNV